MITVKALTVLLMPAKMIVMPSSINQLIVFSLGAMFGSLRALTMIALDLLLFLSSRESKISKC